jgi:uncharacterized protein YjiS (DUF1127 family)
MMSAVPHLDPFGSASRQPRGFGNTRLVSPLAVAAEALQALGSWLAAFLRRRRDARLLSGLSDHVLHDIGITRSDIERVVRGGR